MPECDLYQKLPLNLRKHIIKPPGRLVAPLVRKFQIEEIIYLLANERIGHQALHESLT